VRLGWRWAVRPGQCDLDDVLGRGRRSVQQVGGEVVTSLKVGEEAAVHEPQPSCLRVWTLEVGLSGVMKTVNQPKWAIRSLAFQKIGYVL
jgi:hypothetical protein